VPLNGVGRSSDFIHAGICSGAHEACAISRRWQATETTRGVSLQPANAAVQRRDAVFGLPTKHPYA